MQVFQSFERFVKYLKKVSAMYKKQTRIIPNCMECGDKIHYGRADKKFCSEECKVKYYNELGKVSRTYRRRVLSSISRNYEILDQIICSGVDNISLVDIMALGFVPGIMTSHRRIRGRNECACFDIKYYMTESRIYSIMKIRNVSLPLQDFWI